MSSESSDRRTPSSIQFEVDAPEGATIEGDILHWDVMRRKASSREVTFTITYATRIDASGSHRIALVCMTSRDSKLGFDAMVELAEWLVPHVAPKTRYFMANHQERKLVG